jgi:hypothetical protein
VSTQKLFPLSYETLHPSFLRVSFNNTCAKIDERPRASVVE